MIIKALRESRRRGTGYLGPRCANRGGNWNNGTNAGVFNLNFNNPRSNSNDNIGGRPASLSAGKVCMISRDHAGAETKGACFPSWRRSAGKKYFRLRKRTAGRVTSDNGDVRGGNVTRSGKAEN